MCPLGNGDDDRDALKKFGDELPKKLLDLPQHFTHPSVASQNKNTAAFFGGAGIAAGVVAGIIGLKSDEPHDNVLGGLRLAESVSGLGEMIADRGAVVGGVCGRRSCDRSSC
jgi:hypothetical protein